jgi:hypothetical protein
MHIRSLVILKQIVMQDFTNVAQCNVIQTIWIQRIVVYYTIHAAQDLY